MSLIWIVQSCSCGVIDSTELVFILMPSLWSVFPSVDAIWAGTVDPTCSLFTLCEDFGWHWFYLSPKWRWYEPYCFINYDKKFGCWVQKVLLERILEIFLDPHFAKWRWVKSTHPDFIVRLRFLWPFATISNHKNVWRTVQEHVLADSSLCLLSQYNTHWMRACFQLF